MCVINFKLGCSQCVRVCYWAVASVYVSVTRMLNLITCVFYNCNDILQLFVDVINDPGVADCGIGYKKRSVDYSPVRSKRQNSVVFPNVTINWKPVTSISQLLPTVMNVSLDSGE